MLRFCVYRTSRKSDNPSSDRPSADENLPADGPGTNHSGSDAVETQPVIMDIPAVILSTPKIPAEAKFSDLGDDHPPQMMTVILRPRSFPA